MMGVWPTSGFRFFFAVVYVIFRKKIPRPVFRAGWFAESADERVSEDVGSNVADGAPDGDWFAVESEIGGDGVFFVGAIDVRNGNGPIGRPSIGGILLNVFSWFSGWSGNDVFPGGFGDGGPVGGGPRFRSHRADLEWDHAVWGFHFDFGGRFSDEGAGHRAAGFQCDGNFLRAGGGDDGECDGEDGFHGAGMVGG